jgi:hypothetical protein
MNFSIDASFCEPGSTFRFLSGNKVALSVIWDGTAYKIGADESAHVEKDGGRK